MVTAIKTNLHKLQLKTSQSVCILYKKVLNVLKPNNSYIVQLSKMIVFWLYKYDGYVPVNLYHSLTIAIVQ